jgi:transcriptional regulator with XRE-family HTH domain
MARPLSTARSGLASAIVRLREALGETQLEFSKRLGATPGTIARYETTRQPRGETLKRLYRIAAKHHPPSANAFLLAMDYERELRGRQHRMRAIADLRNLDAAGAELMGAYIEHQSMMQGIRENCDPQLMFVQRAEDLGERLLRLADLLLPEKRKEIE